jgi:hypothetical protein
VSVGRRYRWPVSEAQQPNEQEIREYLAQLRGAPAAQVVSEVLYGLLNAAQAKLGRHDGRLMIDLSGLILDHARPFLPSDQLAPLDQVLSQLRLGQVQAEQEVAAKGAAEPNDLPAAPSPPAAGPAAPSTSQLGEQPGQRPASKLWVPGQNL